MKLLAGALLVGLVFISLAGCVADVGSNSDRVGDDRLRHGRPVSIIGAPTIPAVILGTESGHDIALRLGRVQSCASEEWNPKPVINYKLFDKLGLQADGILHIDPDAKEQIHSLTVEGVPPWLLAGDGFPCHHPMASWVGNVTGGFPLDLDHGFDHNDAVRRDMVMVELDPGQSQAEAEWQPQALTWRLQTVVARVVAGEDAFRGAISIYFPDGSLLKRMTVDLQGRTEVEGQALRLEAGPHRIVVEPSVPLREPASIRVAFQHVVLHDALCIHGFEWDDLCQ